MKKILLIIAGSLSVVLGVIGIFIPLLPTTPFLLLAAACYVRSSDKLYQRLINNKYLGKYILNYREKRGVPLQAKIAAIIFLWASMIINIVYIVKAWQISVLLIIIAVVVTVHLIRMKTMK